jgi:hypothetical protein
MSIQSNFPALDPTLLLDFANVKALDPRVTFTRASTGTFYGTQTAKAEENLITNSEDFTAWGQQGVVIVANDIAAPTGATTADKVSENTTTDIHRVQPSTVSFVSGLAYTFSAFVKDGDRNFIQFFFPSAFSTADYANFNVSAGTLGTVGGSATATITSIGGGWYRCSVTATATSSASGATSIALITSSTSARAESYLGVSKFVYLWGAQLEQRSAVTAYTVTTTQPITNYIPVLQTAASGVARFEHNPTTFESLGLEIEEQRSNLMTYSDDFANAAWGKTNSSITSNTIVAPDGTLTGDKLVEAVSTTIHRISQQATTSATATNSGTVYVKAAERTQVNIALIESTGTHFYQAIFDLTTLVISAGGSGTVTNTATSITPVGNGWFRCSITAAFGSGTAVRLAIDTAAANSAVTTGNGWNGLYIWGAQLEVGAFPTSYIQTVASQVTRAADAASMTGTNFSSWYNQAEGTVFSEIVKSSSNIGGAWDINAGGTANSIRLTPNNTTQFYRVNTSLLEQVAFDIAANSNGSKATITYRVNDFAASVNGGTVSTDTNGSIPVVDRLLIGSYNTVGANNLNGTIRKIAYYPLRVTNANLQALTS